MKIPAAHLRLAQQILKDRGFYPGQIDGDFGKLSTAAALCNAIGAAKIAAIESLNIAIR
jgi:hypothetical protein